MLKLVSTWEVTNGVLGRAVSVTNQMTEDVYGVIHTEQVFAVKRCYFNEFFNI